MRRNKRRLTVGLLSFVALGGASALAWSVGAFEGGVTLEPGANETGGNYATTVNDTAAVLLGDGSAVLNNPVISNSGNNGMGVALQGASVLSLNNAFITMTGGNNVGFLFDNGAQTLTVTDSTLGAQTVAIAQNGSYATLNLVGNDKINGAISTTADSTLNINMSSENTFRGTLNGNISVALSSDSVLYLTGDSFISSLSDDLAGYDNIYLCDHTLTTSEGEIAGNTAECGEMVGGKGAPARPIDDTPPAPQPDPTPPEPDPVPDPQPDPTPPTPQPDSAPTTPTTPTTPEPEPAPAPAPVYQSAKGPYNPYTADNINLSFAFGAIALVGFLVSPSFIFKSLRKR